MTPVSSTEAGARDGRRTKARANVLLHLVLVAAGDGPLPAGCMRDAMLRSVAASLRRARHQALEMVCLDDHLHLLVDLHHTASVQALVRRVKTASSRWSQRTGFEAPAPVWMHAYLAASVSPSRLHIAHEWLRDQRPYHAHVTLAEELLAFGALAAEASAAAPPARQHARDTEPRV